MATKLKLYKKYDVGHRVYVDKENGIHLYLNASYGKNTAKTYCVQGGYKKGKEIPLKCNFKTVTEAKDYFYKELKKLGKPANKHPYRGNKILY